MVNLKKKLKDKALSIGSWLQFNSPDVAEVMAKAGFEWLAVDMEHGPIDVTDLSNLFRAIENGGAVPLARLSENNPYLIKRVLDAGAKGIIVPMIKTADEIKQAVDSAQYPPKGRRGIGYARANNYGLDFKAYLNHFNDDVVVVAQIEDIGAVNNIEEIFSIKEIDSFLIGPYDLSGSMNKTGCFDDPEVKAAIQKVLDAAKKQQITPGIHVIPPDVNEVRQRIKEGFKFIAVSVDAYMLGTLASQLLKELL
ncbi:MAG: aldolase/citrate lyase family protein [Phycisphaerae bacterium]|jgi:2-dehydro-3-deoxyglucarate aldolase